MNRTQAEIKLKRVFNIEHFYDEQWNAISKILAGERVLMIERTGFGKSLCYQFPAILFQGITIVFSPLIALMRDQVNGLKSKGINAAYINSEQSEEENNQVIEQALNNQLKILYIAPERQENQQWLEAVRKMRLSMVVIDEAHTISTWGHDFRPAFRRIINLVELLPSHLPVLATTATATKRVQHDIEQQIGGKLTTIRGSLKRENFKLFVIRVKSAEEKMIWLAQHLNSFKGTGIIYSGTRFATENYAKWLQYVGIDAIDYNAGFDADTRKSVEKGLLENKWKCIVSTNALGMGIDKPDIRFVIHTQMPVSPIHYYQEIGRAGRDGLPTIIILFFNDNKDEQSGVSQDLELPKHFIESSRPSKSKYMKIIELLKEEPLSERLLAQKSNIKLGQVRTIKYDLMDQGIIKEVLLGKSKKYEYQYNAPTLNYQLFDRLRELKLKDLRSMEKYVYTSSPRMGYLCHFLDSDEDSTYSNCDNTNLPKAIIKEQDSLLANKLQEFRETYFPVLELCDFSFKTPTFDGEKIRFTVRTPYPDVIEIKKGEQLYRFENSIKDNYFTEQELGIIKDIISQHRKNKSHITNGVAAAYYGVTNVGTTLHRCKYNNGGDFPQFLLKLTLKAFRKIFGAFSFDMVLYVPPTISGDLVRNFATSFASIIKVPICHRLTKTRTTKEQKVFNNRFGKHDNVENAFDIDIDVKDKTIILIDDIYDSGETLKEIGRLLTTKGAKWIAPVVIAKTVGGTPQ